MLYCSETHCSLTSPGTHFSLSPLLSFSSSTLKHCDLFLPFWQSSVIWAGDCACGRQLDRRFLSWTLEQPVERSSPDREDDRKVASTVLSSISLGSPVPLPTWPALDYRDFNSSNSRCFTKVAKSGTHYKKCFRLESDRLASWHSDLHCGPNIQYLLFFVCSFFQSSLDAWHHVSLRLSGGGPWGHLLAAGA